MSSRAIQTAYVLLHFPDPTETFIFREIINLRRFGLPLQVFTLYGEITKDLSVEMRTACVGVQRLGWRALPRMIYAIGYWWRRKPRVVKDLLHAMRQQRWRDIEKSAENIFALLASFELARRFEVEEIGHIHAPWASGCATAAWAAAKLTGQPFSFTARAWDIYPPDGLIRDKIRDAEFVRTETAANIRHLSAYADNKLDKFRVTYNGVPLRANQDATVAMQPPYHLLAMGRFVRKKGFNQLLYAARLLADAGVDFHLTIAGDGILRWSLKWLAFRLKIADRVHFPGFVPYDKVGKLFATSDIFIMPSAVAPSGDRDGLPTVILEALAHRLPVVTTSVSGIPELIEDGVTGLLVPERDPGAIAAAVQRLIADRSAALALAEAGRARVEEQFNPERNHRNVFELYQRIGSSQ